MLFYYLFWMITGFIIHFYITFGANLIRGPAQIVVFFPILVFRRKGISNGVQTEWNLQERSFWNKRDPEDLEWKSRNNRGSHEGARRAPTLVGPLSVYRPTSSSYIYPCTPKTSEVTTKNYFHRRNLLYSRDPILEPSSALRGGGIDHGGPLHHLQGLSDELWVVYHRPSGP